MNTLRTVGKDLFYRFVRIASRLIVILLFDFRTVGREHLHGLKGAMILSTHQSMLDPVLVGICFNGRLNYIARKTLFHSRWVAFIINVLDAIEIDRDRGGLSGLREMMVRLQAEKKVLIFPEGTRSHDGEIGEIKMGFAPIARRCDVPLIPIAIVGADKILPRGRWFPSRQPLAVVVGPPIPSREVIALNDASLKSRITTALHACKQQGESLIAR